MAEETDLSEVATQTAKPPAVSKRKPPAPGPETDDLVKRAANGDKSCLPTVQALLADGDRGESYRDAFGSSASWFRHSVIKKAAGADVLIQEAIDQKLDEVQSELEGPNPTPIERLLAERASLCWFIVHWYENAYANADGWNLSQANFQHRKIDKAHARFLSALRTLAQVRKLALPTLQVNIARNQVNVAESGSSLE
jgi:hypothetical protein